jgi:hypothetical protein
MLLYLDITQYLPFPVEGALTNVSNWTTLSVLAARSSLTAFYCTSGLPYLLVAVNKASYIIEALGAHANYSYFKNSTAKAATPTTFTIGV